MQNIVIQSSPQYIEDQLILHFGRKYLTLPVSQKQLLTTIAENRKQDNKRRLY